MCKNKKQTCTEKYLTLGFNKYLSITLKYFYSNVEWSLNFITLIKYLYSHIKMQHPANRQFLPSKSIKLQFQR